MKKEMAIVALSEKPDSIEKDSVFEQKPVETIEDLYENYKADAKAQIDEITLGKKTLTKKGRAHFIFPLLERHKIETWSDIVREVGLIDEGISPLSRIAREAVNHIHTHCLIMYAKRAEANG